MYVHCIIQGMCTSVFLFTLLSIVGNINLIKKDSLRSMPRFFVCQDILTEINTYKS